MCAGGGLRIGRRRDFRFLGVLKGRDAVVHGAGTNPRRRIHGEVGHVGVGMHHLRGASVMLVLLAGLLRLAQITCMCADGGVEATFRCQ